MTRDEKRDYMRLWRKRKAKLVRAYERNYRVRRNALARKRWRANADRMRARSNAWRARNPDWMKNHYRLNLSQYTGKGKWSTKSVRARRAFREWARTMAANRKALECAQ